MSDLGLIIQHIRVYGVLNVATIPAKHMRQFEFVPMSYILHVNFWYQKFKPIFDTFDKDNKVLYL